MSARPLATMLFAVLSAFLLTWGPAPSSAQTAEKDTPPPCHAAVLVYHHIGYLPANPTQAERNVTNTPEAFRAHMKLLHDEGFNVVGFSDVVACTIGEGALPEKAVVITFDDGIKSQFTKARPVLKEYGFTATFFVVTDYVGHGGNVMSWDDLHALETEGMTVASHTRKHRWLTRISDEALAEELAGSKARLEAELGHSVDYLAYPFGAYDARAMAAAQAAGYLAARSIKHGTEHLTGDLYATHIVGTTDSLAVFRRAVTLP